MATSDEPQLRVLYEFDWDASKLRTSSRQTGTLIGWWDGRYWQAAFGDGVWSPQYVTAWRRLRVLADA